MRYILIVDCETTGLDPAADKVIELGWILFDAKYVNIVRQSSTLFGSSEPNRALHINGIEDELIEGLDECSHDHPAIVELSSLGSQRDDRSDVVMVAHGAEFERAFLGEFLFDKNWVCSKQDIDWFATTKQQLSLVNLAVEHHVPVVSVHRALDDCKLLADIFRHYIPHDIKTMLEDGMKPSSLYAAQVSYQQKNLAKDAGFQWDDTKRVWCRKLKDHVVDYRGYDFPFAIKKLDPEPA